MKQPIYIQYYNSPCGEIILASVGNALCLCDWNGMPSATRNKQRLKRLLNAELKEYPSETINHTEQQLDEYFAGKRTIFDIPLLLVGTTFQKNIWNALLEIPFGETRTYKQISQRVNNPKGIRAVAQAIGANGISILIPCHRIIGSDHSLTGYAGGLGAKATLLELEKMKTVCRVANSSMNNNVSVIK